MQWYRANVTREGGLSVHVLSADDYYPRGGF